MRLPHRTLIPTALALGLAFSLAACGDDDDTPANGNDGDITDGGSDDGSTAAGEALLRVIHLSPDAPAVDVWARGGDAPAVEALAFPEGTPYLTLPAGTYDFDVVPAGADPTDSANVALAVDGVALAEDAAYTVAAYDVLSMISPLLLVDDRTPPADGNIRVRAIHTAVGVGQVDIWEISGTPLALVENLDFGAAAEALEVPAGSYRLGLDVDDDATPDLSFALTDVPAGVTANVFAVTAASGSPFLLLQLDDGSVARVDPES